MTITPEPESTPVEELRAFFLRRSFLRPASTVSVAAQRRHEKANAIRVAQGYFSRSQLEGNVITSEEWHQIQKGLELDPERMTYLAGFMDGWNQR
jgi:hypothetical protein